MNSRTTKAALEVAKQDAGNRLFVGLQAVWEIEALARAALRTAADLRADDSVHDDKLLLRGLLARVLQLSGNVRDVLGDQSVSTKVIEQAVIGDAEVVH